MLEYLIGLLSIIFFGGGLIFVYFKDKDKLDWKFVGTCLIFVVGGFFLMSESEYTSGETIVMETGEETLNNNDTVIAGDYEYTLSKVGTESSLEYINDTMQANGEYLILEFGIKNNSDYPFSMDINTPFYLVNEDKFFEFDYNLSWSYTDDEIGNSGLWSSSNSINPGNEHVSYAVFDVPTDIINSEQTQLLIFTDDSAPADIYFNIN